MTDMTVANTIAQQIGGRAFMMMGAKNKLGDHDSLSFKIGRNAKKVTHITVTLRGDDTYSVDFLRCRRERGVMTTREIACDEGVYNDQLRAVIEAGTGLYLSL